MKKLLTVLLVIAVICTFSFGSAFAVTAAQTAPYKAVASYDKLYEASAYEAYTGQYGITEAYRTALVKDWTKVLNDYEPVTGFTSATDAYLINYSNYFSAEYDTAKAAVEAAIESFKTATTAKAAKAVETALVTKLSKLKASNVLTHYGLVATMTNNTFATPLDVAMGGNLGAESTKYLLPGYGYFTELSATTKLVDNLNHDKGLFYYWMIDNGYRTFSAAKAHLNDFKAALVPLTEAKTKEIQAEYNAINNKLYAVAKSWSEGNNYGVGTVSGVSLDSLEALIAEAKAFESKYIGGADAITAKTYATWTNDPNMTDYSEIYEHLNANVIDTLEYAYYNQYAAEVKAVDLKDKAAVVALADKLYELTLNYNYVADADNSTAKAYIDATEDYAKLQAAYEEFANNDLELVQDLYSKGFNEISTSVYSVASDGTTVSSASYFDATEENVAKMDALRKAYDEVVNNYGYDCTDFANGTYVGYSYCDECEAKLLAGEHNKAAAAGFDEKNDELDNTKLQAYLNNATLSVKSTKLAAKKVKVQAKFAAADYANIVGQFGKGYTMSYKFYFKAPGKSYKLTKTKDVNYITYTSKSLKAGKNYFKVGVVVKNADGKVVAEKLYNASNAAYRTIK